MPSSISVLIVDDEIAIRESLAAFFEDFGYAILTAESAEEALVLVENESPDVVIVDLRLPGISGESLILKAHEQNPTISFIIHTGSVDYKLSEQLKAIGLTGDDLYLKPLVDLKILVDKIREMTEKE